MLGAGDPHRVELLVALSEDETLGSLVWLRESVCAHGASPPPPQVGREAQIMWLLQARLKRWEGIKRGQLLPRETPIEELSLSLPRPSFFLKTEHTSCVLRGPQEQFSSDSRRLPLSKDTGSF